MILSHRYLVNKIARQIYPRNNEILRFRTKRRQRLVGRFQPYRNYNEMGLSSIANLKKDLPLNMMDDHRNSDRMSIFYKEKIKELEKRRKDNPFQRDYFKFQRSHQTPYRLGHEDNERLLYNKFCKSWETQKEFNLMAFRLDQFFADQSLLEIAQPESFIGHFDAIVETQRTLKRRHLRMKHLFVQNRIRHEKIGTSWLNATLMRSTPAQLIGTSVPNRVKVRATLEARYKKRNYRTVFEKFIITRRMTLARGRRRPWNIQFNRRRYGSVEKEKRWKNIDKKNKPNLVIYANKERRRYYSFFDAVETLRFGMEQIEYMNFYNDLGSDATFSSLYANNFWTRAKIRVLKNLEFPIFVYHQTGTLRFPHKTLKPSPRVYLQDFNEITNSLKWAHTLWVSSFSMLAGSIRVLMATFGLTMVREVRACMIDQVETILNLRMIVRNIVLKKFFKERRSLYTAALTNLYHIDHLLNEWFTIGLHPFSTFTHQIGRHKLRETILLDPIELKKKDENGKPVLFYAKETLGIDLYQTVMNYLFTSHGNQLLPNYGLFMTHNLLPLHQKTPLIFKGMGCHIPASVQNFMKIGERGMRVFYRNFRKMTAAPIIASMLWRIGLKHLDHRDTNFRINYISNSEKPALERFHSYSKSVKERFFLKKKRVSIFSTKNSIKSLFINKRWIQFRFSKIERAGKRTKKVASIANNNHYKPNRRQKFNKPRYSNKRGYKGLKKKYRKNRFVHRLAYRKFIRNKKFKLQ